MTGQPTTWILVDLDDEMIVRSERLDPPGHQFGPAGDLDAVAY
jgi:hypothetical protein